MVLMVMKRRSAEELVRGAKEGEKEAFAELTEIYRTRLEALAASRLTPALRSKISVEDVVQETITRAFESIGGFEWRGEDSFLRWLGAISRNVVAQAARDRGGPLDVDLLRSVPGSGPSPSRLAQREERLERLEGALGQLTPDQREALRLSRIQGMRIREIAERMGKTPDAVQQLIVRGLRSLKRNFGDTQSIHLPDRPLDFGTQDAGEGETGRKE